MTSKAKIIPEIDLFECPFFRQCILPKNEYCNLLRYKLCPEYTSREKRLKSKHLF